MFLQEATSLSGVGRLERKERTHGRQTKLAVLRSPLSPASPTVIHALNPRSSLRFLTDSMLKWHRNERQRMGNASKMSPHESAFSFSSSFAAGSRLLACTLR